MPVYIETVSKLGKHIRITKRHWDYLIGKHESLTGLEAQVREKHDVDFLRFYKKGELEIVGVLIDLKKAFIAKMEIYLSQYGGEKFIQMAESLARMGAIRSGQLKHQNRRGA